MRRRFSLAPPGARWAALVMLTELTEREHGRADRGLEAVFDIVGGSVRSERARPRRERSVAMLRDPGFPTVPVRGNPQPPNRLGVFVAAHVRPFSRIAAFHSSDESSHSLKLRQTCDRWRSSSTSGRSAHQDMRPQLADGHVRGVTLGSAHGLPVFAFNRNGAPDGIRWKARDDVVFSFSWRGIADAQSQPARRRPRG